MSAHTRRHHTSKTITSTKEDELIPWRKIFKTEIDQFSEAGLVLKGNRHKAGMTQQELADEIEVKAHHISEMEHGKRPIGKNMARRLSKVFKVDYRVFL